jgi:hypothetical protein
LCLTKVPVATETSIDLVIAKTIDRLATQPAKLFSYRSVTATILSLVTDKSSIAMTAESLGYVTDEVFVTQKGHG